MCLSTPTLRAEKFCVRCCVWVQLCQQVNTAPTMMNLCLHRDTYLDHFWETPRCPINGHFQLSNWTSGRDSFGHIDDWRCAVIELWVIERSSCPGTWLIDSDRNSLIGFVFQKHRNSRIYNSIYVAPSIDFWLASWRAKKKSSKGFMAVRERQVDVRESNHRISFVRFFVSIRNMRWLFLDGGRYGGYVM